MIERNKTYLFIAFFTILLITSYSSLVSHDTILSYDDKMLLGSLKTVNGVSDYYSAITQGRVLDLQPIRDLSYFIDFRLFDFLSNHYSFHLTNIFLLIGICFFAEKLFRLFEIRSSYIYLFLILFAFSPVTSSSTGWISARKHLLSTFFILWANYQYLKNDSHSPKNITLTILLYSLSVLSHPISVLWPFWILLWDCREKIKIRIQHLILCSLSLLFVVMNFWYYRYIYSAEVSSFSKFSSMDTYNLGTPLLAIGRYLFQVFFPFSALPTTHYPGSIENLIGLAWLIILSFLVLKIHKNKTYALLMAYFFFPLVIVTVNMTNIFCSDTYLLNSSVGMYILLAIYLQNQKHQKIILSCLSLYVAFICFYNFNYVRIFNTEDELWRYSYEKEPTPQNAGVRSSTLVKQGNFEESYKVIERVQNDWPNHPFLSQLISENVFFNPKITNPKKIDFLEAYPDKTSSIYFYLAVLNAREKNKPALEKNIPKIFLDQASFNTEFRGNEELVGAAIQYMCNFYSLVNCKQGLEVLRYKLAGKRWKESLFQDYLYKLESNKEFYLDIKI